MLVQYRYLMPGEMVSAGLQASDSIEEADALYADAMDVYRDAVGLVVAYDEEKLRISLA